MKYQKAKLAIRKYKGQLIIIFKKTCSNVKMGIQNKGCIIKLLCDIC